MVENRKNSNKGREAQENTGKNKIRAKSHMGLDLKNPAESANIAMSEEKPYKRQKISEHAEK